MVQKNTNNIISLISDSDLERELSLDVRKRILEQKLFYVSEKMSSYFYNYVKERETAAKTIQDRKNYWNFLHKNISKKEKIAFISLGCGNSGPEKYALERLKKDGYDFIYIGVDVSKFMLQKAVKNLKNVNVNKIFLQADMTSENFKDSIVELTKDCQKRIYAFFGATFGNVNQTNMADVLYNLLQKNDLLWLDVIIRPSLSKEDDIKLFKHYVSRLTNPKTISFLSLLFGPLESLGIPRNLGEVGLKINQERSVGSLLFIFYFKIQNKTAFDFIQEKIHLLPNEEIELINIRAYHPKTLINFFREHEFRLLNVQQKERKGQFMFKRK